MSQKNLEIFKQVLVKSTLLQERLKPVLDKGSFVQLLVELGAERGYTFTAEEVELSVLEPAPVAAASQFRVQSIKMIW